jgi:pilus assembly protein CpaE
MAKRNANPDFELTALLIAPGRALAEQFLEALRPTRTFQILAELRSYPSRHTLEIRLRQLEPDVVLLDVETDPEAACELVGLVASFRPVTQVVGLALANDSELVVRVLRLGASEFLAAPFSASEQREAAARIRRLRAAEPGPAPEAGQVVVFTSAKPGAGASALAAQTALALRRRSGERVLLVDLDLCGGSLAFYLRLHPAASVADALEQAGDLDPARWASLVAHCEGVEVLAAPEEPETDAVEPNRLHDLLEFARLVYAWTVLDVPAAPHRTSLLALSESDAGFLVSTGDVASLHLTHRTAGLLEQLGFARERLAVLINRYRKQEGVGPAEIGKMFRYAVAAVLPNDYFALHQAISLGQPVAPDSALGRALDRVASALLASDASQAARAGAALGAGRE